ncbi:hypothetical protein LT493_39195 [Streptomyces tricolor]|nr:hypothetical protein [Streptomyces tricolor]
MLTRGALPHLAAEGPDRAVAGCNLGYALLVLSDAPGQGTPGAPDRLAEAVRVFRTAFAATPPDHGNHARCANGLALALLATAARTEDRSRLAGGDRTAADGDPRRRPRRRQRGADALRPGLCPHPARHERRAGRGDVARGPGRGRRRAAPRPRSHPGRGPRGARAHLERLSRATLIGLPRADPDRAARLAADAADALRRLLDLTPEGHPEREDVRLRLAANLIAAGRPQEGIGLLAAADPVFTGDAGPTGDTPRAAARGGPRSGRTARPARPRPRGAGRRGRHRRHRASGDVGGRRPSHRRRAEPARHGPAGRRQRTRPGTDGPRQAGPRPPRADLAARHRRPRPGTGVPAPRPAARGRTRAGPDRPAAGAGPRSRSRGSRSTRAPSARSSTSTTGCSPRRRRTPANTVCCAPGGPRCSSCRPCTPRATTPPGWSGCARRRQCCASCTRNCRSGWRTWGSAPELFAGHTALAFAYDSPFEHVQALEDGVRGARRRLARLTPGTREYDDTRTTLAMHLFTRHGLWSEEADYTEAEALARELTATREPDLGTVLLAQQWASAAQSRVQRGRLLETGPAAAGRSPSLIIRLAGDGAAQALDRHDPVEALETLEDGRAHLLSTALNARRELSALHGADAALHARLRVRPGPGARCAGAWSRAAGRARRRSPSSGPPPSTRPGSSRNCSSARTSSGS